MGVGAGAVVRMRLRGLLGVGRLVVVSTSVLFDLLVWFGSAPACLSTSGVPCRGIVLLPFSSFRGGDENAEEKRVFSASQHLLLHSSFFVFAVRVVVCETNADR